MSRDFAARSTRIIPLCLSVCALLAVGASSLAAESAPAPNIVYILCDDLGYGDVHALNPERSKIPTPNFDRLVAEGMTFTDCHSGSSVCTPTRYGILTGRYAWRTRLQSGVLDGFGEPLVAPDRLTVATLLKQHGYATAAIGKWHLGLRFGPNRWTDPIADGPLQHGFDSFFGISASLDMPPFAFIENDRFTQEPTVTKTWMRSGPAAKDFEAVDVLPELTRRAKAFIAAQAAGAQPGDAKTTASAPPAAAKPGRPFFLYLALASPHTPLVPSPEWQGKSPLGEYGDFVMQTDWAVGQVMEALAAAGVAQNTLLVLTSDNGFAPYVGVAKLESQGHYPSADFRGYKADIWEGGHHIPFIARWPARVKPGSRSGQLLCLTDLMATAADLVAAHLPAAAGEDSVSFLPALVGADAGPLREAVVHHSVNGVFAIRAANWKLELCPGSGGWAEPKDAAARKQGLPSSQLYDLAADPGERQNVVATKAAEAQRLTSLLEQCVARGRSTPGEDQKNDATINLWKTK